jgi:hypothetical protein
VWDFFAIVDAGFAAVFGKICERRRVFRRFVCKILHGFCLDAPRRVLTICVQIVEGRVVHGHKVILTLLSERFRAMFSAGNRLCLIWGRTNPPIRQCTQGSGKLLKERLQYLILNMMCSSECWSICTLEWFQMRLHHLLWGWKPKTSNSWIFCRYFGVEWFLALVFSNVSRFQVADQFMLDHLKQICENKLQAAVNESTVETLLEVAEMHNAYQLKAVCHHYVRNAS